MQRAVPLAGVQAVSYLPLSGFPRARVAHSFVLRLRLSWGHLAGGSSQQGHLNPEQTRAI